MTEISARKWVENDRTDVPHLFGFVKITKNIKIHSLLRYMVCNLVEKLSRWEFGQKSQHLESYQNGFAYSGKS